MSDRQQMLFNEKRGNVAKLEGAVDETGAYILNSLKLAESFAGQTIQQTITVIKSTGDEGMCEMFRYVDG